MLLFGLGLPWWAVPVAPDVPDEPPMFGQLWLSGVPDPPLPGAPGVVDGVVGAPGTVEGALGAVVGGVVSV